MVRHFAWVFLAVGSLTAIVTADEPPNDLTLAAACLERGEETAAVAYLTRYVTAHPDQAIVRAALADLLWRRDQWADAQAHYERFITDAQLGPLDPARQVQAHTRLMAVAQRNGDAYAEHLHRGIGLYLIARQTAEDAAESEALLCKAAGELALAQQARPQEARPYWYAYLVWSRLGQSLPAGRSLRQAAHRADDADLTPAERRDLVLATGGPAQSK
jgi:hypothetical protein